MTRETTSPGDAPTHHGWIDPFADRPKPVPPACESASTGSRLAMVAVDFVLFKIATSAVALAGTGVGMLAIASGSDDVSAVATWTAHGLAALLSLLYFVGWPALRDGRTVGRRLAGVEVRVRDGHRGAHIATHDFLVFFLPSLLLDPIAVVGPRDLAVLALWLIGQAWRSPDAEPVAANLLGISFVHRVHRDS